MNTKLLQQTLGKAVRVYAAGLAPDLNVIPGLETRTVPREYDWDGLKRGGNPQHPYVVFQYTLDGWGCYEDARARYQLTPQHAFAAIVPSTHRYYLPAESGGWTFFFMIIKHPYVVQRLIARQGSCGPVLAIPPEHVLIARAVTLFEGYCRNSFPDGFAREQALFDFLFEYERFAHASVYSRAARDRLLDDVRRFVLARRREPVEVEQLASRHGMSRSHFSHYFKAETGLSPARFITETRLQEVSRRLLQGNDTLKEIAADTGFADPNHLCKVFRRFYHISPGAFRKQVR